MSPQFARSTGRLVSLGAAAIVIALKASVALAACQLPSGTTPGLCTYSGSGPALQITDPANSTATATPSTFKGIATGTSGHGVTGEATGKNGVGGFFQAVAPATSSTTTTALQAVNSGGSTSAEGNYGSAGVFTITNAKNESPGVAITTNGINSYGLSVVNNGTIDGKLLYGPPSDAGAVAGYFEVSNANNFDYELEGSGLYEPSAIFAVNSGGKHVAQCCIAAGSAGYFEITNPFNNDAAVFATTASAYGTAVFGLVSGNGGAYGAGIDASDRTSLGQYGLYAESINGKAAFVQEVSGSYNYCYFNGGSDWACAADAKAMVRPKAPKHADLLDKLDAMPVNYYEFKDARHPARYLGPSGQDFKAAFGLGESDPMVIDRGNASGVALAAAQGLYRKLKQDEATIAAQNARIATLEGQLAAQQGVTDRLARLEAAMARLSPVTNTAMLAK